MNTYMFLTAEITELSQKDHQQPCKCSYTQIKVLTLYVMYGKDQHGRPCQLSASASSCLARFICRLPCLADLTMDNVRVNEDFYSTASSLAPSTKV